MLLIPSKPFQKSVRRLTPSAINAINERLNLFAKDPFHPILHNHPLSGKYKGYRSINITGDYQLIFVQLNKETVRLLDVDTHHNLYST